MARDLLIPGSGVLRDPEDGTELQIPGDGLFLGTSGGATTPGSILVYDEIWVREPRLMVPGQAPVGPVRHDGRDSVAFAWIASPKLTQCLVGGRELTAVGAGVFDVVSGVPAYKRTAEGIYLYGSSWAPVVTSDGSGTGDFTVFVMYRVTQGSPDTLFVQRSNTAAAYKQFAIQANVNATGSGVPYKVQFSTYNSGYTSLELVDVYAYGDWNCCAMSRVGGSLYAVNYNFTKRTLLEGSTSGTVRDITAADSQLGIGVSMPAIAARTASIAYCQANSQGVGPGRLRNIVMDPFQYLIPA